MWSLLCRERNGGPEMPCDFGKNEILSFATTYVRQYAKIKADAERRILHVLLKWRHRKLVSGVEQWSLQAEKGRERGKAQRSNNKYPNTLRWEE